MRGKYMLFHSRFSFLSHIAHTDHLRSYLEGLWRGYLTQGSFQYHNPDVCAPYIKTNTTSGKATDPRRDCDKGMLKRIPSDTFMNLQLAVESKTYRSNTLLIVTVFIRLATHSFLQIPSFNGSGRVVRWFVRKYH